MEKFAKNFNDLAKKFDDVNANVVSLCAEIQCIDFVINDLKIENQKLKNAVQLLTLKLDNSEAYQRRANLIFAGLECRMADRAGATDDDLAESSMTVTDKVVDFFTNVLQYPISATDISTAHILR